MIPPVQEETPEVVNMHSLAGIACDLGGIVPGWLSPQSGTATETQAPH